MISEGCDFLDSSGALGWPVVLGERIEFLILIWFYIFLLLWLLVFGLEMLSWFYDGFALFIKMCLLLLILDLFLMEVSELPLS